MRRFPEAETVPTSEQVEQHFMEWMLRDDAQPGTAINELDLARQFGVATTGIREFLNRFQRFGLIEKRPNSGWVFKGFTDASRWNCSRSARCSNCARPGLRRAPEKSPLWASSNALRDEHLALLATSTAAFTTSPTSTTASTG